MSALALTMVLVVLGGNAGGGLLAEPDVDPAGGQGIEWNALTDWFTPITRNGNVIEVPPHAFDLGMGKLVRPYR